MKPLLRGHFHQAMFFIVLGAGLPLIFKASAGRELFSVLVYIICALLMFGISALYHRVTWTNEANRFLWKKFDHSAIYLMIAGTFTPIAVMGLSSESSTKLLITIWAVALVGIIQSIFFVGLPKMVSAIIYIIAGYLILPYLGELRAAIGDLNIFFIVLGGLLYSVGAICYGLKRPVFNPKVFSYHEVFHIFVNLGAVAHFVVVNSLVR